MIQPVERMKVIIISEVKVKITEIEKVYCQKSK